jgi:uncharacterized protein (TIGR03437 family)
LLWECVRIRIVSALLALVGATASGQTGIISGSVSGLIGAPPEPPGFTQPPTTDTLGLFGPAGANLVGKSISISYSYNTADFSSSGSSCGTNCTYYTTNTTNQIGNSISVTISGVTKTISPATATETQVMFQNSFPGYSANYFAETREGTDGTGLFFSLFASNSVAFGQPIEGIRPNQTLTVYAGSAYENLGYDIGETAFLQITTSSLPNTVVGQSYSATLTATGGTGGYIWEYFYPGSLPAGFTLSSAGVLSSTGNPAAPAGSYSFFAQVYDSASNVATQPLTLVVVPNPSTEPAILDGGIAPAGSGSNVPVIQPGEWVSIYGTNLASSTMTWSGNFPTSLGGASVTINGKAAYLSYVSPTQINLQAPDDPSTGAVPVAVTTASGTSTATVTLAPFAPSLLLIDAKHVTGIILRSNKSGAYGGGAYDIIGPTGNSLGYATVAAKAGDAIELFAVGLGPTDPVVPAGQVFSGAAPTTNPVDLVINNVSVTPVFEGLSGAGLYQINLTVPAGLGTGDVSLQALVGGVQTRSGVVISLQ